MQPRRFVHILEGVHLPARHCVGLASDVTARLVDHHAGKPVHAAKHRPWQMRVVIDVADAELAARFERYLKSGSGRGSARPPVRSTR